jgi:hypothetical protein
VNIDPEMLAGSLHRVYAGERPDIDEALHRVIRACADLFGVDGSGLMVADQQNDVQSETGRGPCVDTFVRRAGRSSPDTVSGRSSGYRCGWARCRSDHWTSTARDRTCGRTRSGRHSRYSEVVEAILGAALSADAAGELADRLQYALDHRVVIERAVGLLMARAEVDAVTAFNIMRTTARNERRKVAEVAQGLLEAAPSHGRGRPRC